MRGEPTIPAIVTAAGDQAVEQYRTFFAAFKNAATRRLYAVQARRFLTWAETRELALSSIRTFDAVFYIAELAHSVAPKTVAYHRSTLTRLFGRLKHAGVILDDPFDFGPSTNLPQLGSVAAVEWQAVVDVAETALTLHALHEHGLPLGDRTIDQPLCQAILALGAARGITPVEITAEDLAAALFGHEQRTTTSDSAFASDHNGMSDV